MEWDAISQAISAILGYPLNINSVKPLAGGDINAAFRVAVDTEVYFIKVNRPNLVDMFEAEFLGLQEIATTRTLRVPQPIVFGRTDTQAFLMLEYLEWGRSSTASDRLLGLQLAEMHQQVQAYFGWQRDNNIGTNRQANHTTGDWLSFWRDQRLGVQLKLAADHGYKGLLQNLGEQLCVDLSMFFSGYQPLASLLHGDLWGGNVAVDAHGLPVIFDPACYYGDREADIAMIELFGGFSADFYAAYYEAWPLDQGYEIRKDLYNLYHILNHLNLFGGCYLSQAERLMQKLIAEIA